MGEVRRVILPYAPRDVFLPYHERTQRWACAVAHRRCGKTVACINDIVRRAITLELEHGRYAYVAPFLAQAKEIAWDYLKRYAQPIVTDKNEAELWVELVNGARVRLHGADNPDRLRGPYLDGVVADEFGDWRPSVWGEVIRPMLADRIGWATFIGTPKGKNAFFRTLEQAKSDKDWYWVVLKASETRLISQEELDDAKRTMSVDQYEQEFECSFDAAIRGAYFAEGIKHLRAQKRLGRVAADPYMSIRAFWDLGGTGAKSDHTVIWIAQFVGRELRVLDYYEAQGQPLATHIQWLRDKGYEKAICFLPHDGATNDRVYSVSFESALQQAGFETTVVPNQGKGAASARIEAVRRLFPRVWMNEDTCTPGLDALAAYHAKQDEERGIDLGPEHDWASHAADAFGLMCVVYEEPAVKKTDRWKPGKDNSTWMGRL